MKKVEKTTRSFRYDLNQIPYDYTVKVTSRFKGLNLVDRVPEELWTKVCDIVQVTVNKIILKEMQEGKVFEEALQIAEKEEKQMQGRKGRIYPTECRVPENSKER